MTHCPLCKGGYTHGHTTFTVDLGFGVLVVRDVPAHVCSQCGEEWLEDNVSEKLEQFTQEAKRKHISVKVARWSEAVA